MKKVSLLTATAFAVNLSALTPGKAHAQKYQGQMNATAGASFSITGLFVNAVLATVDQAGGVNTSSIPGLNAMFDYGVSDRFSVGAAYYYQSFTTNFTSYTDTSGTVQNGDFKLALIRQNAGARMLFHFGENENLDVYAGARVGFTFWSTKSDVPANSGLDLDVSAIRSRMLPQGIFGMRYYFTDNIGANVELAVGPPYFMMIGLNARFGGSN
jgi:hypothetical protein